MWNGKNHLDDHNRYRMGDHEWKHAMSVNENSLIKNEINYN